MIVYVHIMSAAAALAGRPPRHAVRAGAGVVQLGRHRGGEDSGW